MKVRYFYKDGDSEIGPFTSEKLEQLFQAQLVTGASMVRAEYTEDWLEYEKLVPSFPGNSGTSKISFCEQPESSDKTFSLTEEHKNPSEQSTGYWKNDFPTPWRRYAARLLDSQINGGFAMAIVAVVFYAIAPATADNFFQIFNTEGGVVLDIMITTFAASLIGGPLIGVTGFSLGKLIFGIKVTDLNGQKIGFFAGLKRDLTVYLRGLGLAFPLISLFTMYACYSKLASSEQLAWDKGKHIVWYRPSGFGQYILNVIGLVLIVLVRALISLAAQL